MNIQPTNMNQAQVQSQASVKVAAMGIDSMKQQSENVNKLLQSAQTITDPNMGRNINVLA